MPPSADPGDPGTRWNRPAATAIAAVVASALLATLGAGLWFLRRPPDGPLPPPEAPWPTTGEASVFLCDHDSAYKNCGERAITTTQRLSLERTLRGLPEVSAVRFRSRAEALKDLIGVFPPNALRESDVPESFRVALKTTSDFRRKTEALPGVSNVVVGGTGFWAGKTDVVIELCPRDPLERDERCKGRGETTEAEKTAIHQDLLALDGVGAIYLENRVHAWRDASWRSFAKLPDAATPPAYISESFHLVLDAPDAAGRVRRAVGERPGVNSVDREPSR
ncbi:permease-like cell division protein FtsX [Sphaerisporangium dianthi]|uniref:Permease-like cell division protein FtsX n=1 Tax=Sphaerisporangium dianthi TaxID=1436120 RepID=A0ABV9CTS9_9ACTN